MRHAVLLSTVLLALCAAFAAPVGAQDRGLTAPGDALGGVLGGGAASARWQARLERDGSAPLPSGMPQQTLRLLGDYQLDALRLGQTGGLRLTGGLLINLRNTAALGLASTDAPPPTLPYAGIGYASGNLSGSWGFSADLGLAANGLGLSLGNRNGPLGLGLDGGLRDLRLQPMLRLGMSLSF